MPFDFSKLKAPARQERPIDPIAIFQSLWVTDPSINDLWLAQGDALRGWHEKRTESDAAISLNTGAGKTLVGLLIAQSLVNETRSLVLYACSSIQLIDQTAKKAEGYGLPVTTYLRGQFSNDLATRGESACLTTYQALFNGKSVFFKRDISGIVFDDAHTAEHLLRDHFSLRIAKDRFEHTYSQIAAEFADYFHSVGLSSSFEEILAGSSNRLLLAPPFEVKGKQEAILRVIRNGTVPSDDNTTFAWAYLKDSIDLCAFIISSSEITITPPFVPVRALPYFTPAIRRIYLSATLSAEDVFARTFGRTPSLKIAPTTTAGECERMILVPGRITGVDNDIQVAKDAIRPHKALVLVPSYARAGEWADLVQPPPRDQASEAIEAFKQKSGPEKLLVTARYDGVDLPGDMCRVVVIDDLPSGVGPLERFLWEFLKLSATLRSAIASRVVQSFGRISRGMSDHGVALITGSRLLEWLQIPKNMASLPRFLQKQLQLGVQMSSGMAPADLPSTIGECLTRSRAWVEAYEAFMREASVEEQVPEPTTLVQLALAEAKYAEALWNRDYAGAAAHLQRTLEDAGRFSVGTVCWHKLWMGFALDCAGDVETAMALYQQAHGGQRNIPPLRMGTLPAEDNAQPSQVVSAARLFELSGDGRVRVPRSLDRDLLYLDGTGTPKQAEEALRCLGQYLGLQATRPDNEHGTGPDVLWLSSEKAAICVDAKTDKEAGSVYRKDELGQLADHVQWVRNNTAAEEIIPGFVGPEVPASGSANPQQGVKVASLAKFHAIGEMLKTAYRGIAAASLPLTIGQTVSEEFEKRGLLWPQLLRRIAFIELRELKTP